MEWFRRHLSFANVIAVLALFIALGGTGYAALRLPRNSVGPAQIKKNAVTSSKVKDGSLRAKDFAAGQLPAGERGPAGPQGLQGVQGPAGKDGTDGRSPAVAFARVDGNGTLIGGSAQSSILQSNIQHDAGVPAAESTGAGVYCFGGLPFTPVSAMVTLDNTDALPAVPLLTGGLLNYIPSVAVFKGEDFGRCDAAHGQARVAIEQVTDSAVPTLTNHGFTVWFAGS